MQSITMGKKLAMGAGALVVLLMILSGVFLSTIGYLHERFNTTVDKTARTIVLADTVNVGWASVIGAVRGLIMVTFAKDVSSSQPLKRSFRENAETMRRGLDELRPLLSDPETIRQVEDIQTDLDRLTAHFAEVERLCAMGDAQNAWVFSVEKMLPLYSRLGAASGRLADIQRQRLEQEKTAAADEKTLSRWIAFTLLALALLVGGFVLYQVRHVSAALRQLAAELAEGAEQVASAAAQVSSSSQAMAQGASEQAASLEETSSSTEEINSMTRKNAENSQSAAHVVELAAQEVSDANGKLEQMVGSMKEINASSDRISKIIRVIDEIAFQTNILALNAAVEAARAGEAGMGFAVVAEEVRNLAQRCAQAAKDTAGLIEESIAKSTEGRTKLDQVAEAIAGITTDTTKVKTLVDEVNLGSQEQARGIDQVARAIAQMEQVTQKTAANAEEGASAGEELTAQAHTLHGIVTRLTALVGSHADEHAPARSNARRQEPAYVRNRPPAVPVIGGPRALAPAHPNRAAAQVKELPAGAREMGKDEFPLDDEFREF